MKYSILPVPSISRFQISNALLRNLKRYVFFRMSLNYSHYSVFTWFQKQAGPM